MEADVNKNCLVPNFPSSRVRPFLFLLCYKFKLISTFDIFILNKIISLYFAMCLDSNPFYWLKGFLYLLYFFFRMVAFEPYYIELYSVPYYSCQFAWVSPTIGIAFANKLCNADSTVQSGLYLVGITPQLQLHLTRISNLKTNEQIIRTDVLVIFIFVFEISYASVSLGTSFLRFCFSE